MLDGMDDQRKDRLKQCETMDAQEVLLFVGAESDSSAYTCCGVTAAPVDAGVDRGTSNNKASRQVKM